MILERTSIYCQNCCAQNSLKDSHCQSCGTRLLLVVFPASLQFDSNQVPSFYEDHLLERVTLLELRLIQMSEGLQAAGEIIREQGRQIIEARREIKKLSGEPSSEASRKAKLNFERFPALTESILNAHDSPNAELFSKLLEESLRLFVQDDEKEGFRMLERAVLLSPRNRALLFYAAVEYFSVDLYGDARRHLEKCVELAPDNFEVLLLLGAIAADDGDLVRARRCLSLLAGNGNMTGVVNLIWSLVAAADDRNWAESLAALKVASKTIAVPEVFYLMGCLNFELRDDAVALRCFQKTISLDRKFSDAWFMQALVYDRQGETDHCRNMLDNAAQTKGVGSQCVEFLRDRENLPATALPFRHIQNKRAKVLTGGSVRIGRLIKAELIQIIDRGSTP